MPKTNGSGPKRGRKRKNVWTIPDLEKRVQTLIHEGTLLKKDGEESIIKTITKEFAEQLVADGFRLTRFALKVRIPVLIWTKKVEGDLWNAISGKMLSRFREVYSYIPEKAIAKRARFLKGLTHAKSAVAEFKAGMGVLDDGELSRDAGAFEFPTNSYHEPLVITTAKDCQVPVINGVLMGIPFTDIVKSTFRRALADSRKRRAPAMIITNLFWLYNKKTAGFLAVFRAQWSGIKVNPDRLPAEYRQEAKDILSGKITDELIYLTINEQFNELLDGLDKIMHRPHNKGLEFPGKVYVQLGILEEEFIAAAAYAKCRYFTIVKQNKIEAELNMAAHRLEQARAARDRAGMHYWSEEVARLGRQKARTIITHIAPEHLEYYRRRYRALVVKKLEATIPNCKVVSLGSAWYKIGNKIVKIHVPHNDQVTDGLLDDAASVYGKDVFKDTLADLTIECHPFSLNHRMVGREDSESISGSDVARQPVTKFIRVAPNLLDVPFLREQFKSTIKAVHPAHKLINDAQLKTGLLLVKLDNDILSADPLPIERLDRFDESTNFAYPYPQTPYINIYVKTDDHWGGVAKRFIWNSQAGVSLGISEANIEMKRRSGIINPNDVRVHMVMSMDDPSDGNLWFNPTYRPDPQDMTIIKIQQLLRHLNGEIRRAAEKGHLDKVEQLTDEVGHLVNSQLDFKGEHFPYKQMDQVFDRSIDPNIDFFSAVLGRFVKSKISLTGLSVLNNSRSDTRDIGVINHPTGNHHKNTTNGAELEGPRYARHMRMRLGQLPQWQRYEKEHPGFLESTVRAPHFGGETFGAGVIQAPGRYPWAFRLLGSPPRQNSWSDLLRAMVNSDLARGDDTYALMKYTVVVFIGDKHFYCEVDTETLYYFICAAGVHTDTYGSVGGFPPNNTGVMYVCLPADGPEAGPIIVRMITHDYLRDWFAKPTKFDWAKFLPNPV